MAEVTKIRSKRDSSAARHHELLASIRRIMEAREKPKDKAADTLVKLRKVYEGGRKIRAEAHVAEWGKLPERGVSLRSDLESRTL